jgi:hypothetical protein
MPIFAQRNKYQRALDLYSTIINQYDDRVMHETIRIARCNRAACFLELGKCHFRLAGFK